MIEWIATNPRGLLWVGALSLATVVGSLIALPLVVVRMHPDYFLSTHPPPDSWRGRHPVVRVLLLTAKNSFGAILVLLGVLLSIPLVPGQGVITILLGLSLLDLPGKRALERRIARQPPILAAINWMRRRAGRPAVRIPDPD